MRGHDNSGRDLWPRTPGQRYARPIHHDPDLLLPAILRDRGRNNSLSDIIRAADLIDRLREDLARSNEIGNAAIRAFFALYDQFMHEGEP